MLINHFICHSSVKKNSAGQLDASFSADLSTTPNNLDNGDEDVSGMTPRDITTTLVSTSVDPILCCKLLDTVKDEVVY